MFKVTLRGISLLFYQQFEHGALHVNKCTVGYFKASSLYPKQKPTLASMISVESMISVNSICSFQIVTVQP